MIYFNENDPYAAVWLRNLIEAGHLPKDSHVDDRSICDVTPGDLHGYSRCHFFAGNGAWELALQYAGWHDVRIDWDPAEHDRTVWTGSCPCQPFSQAGKGEAEADHRHLWPEFFRLIHQCRPDVVFGEQVEGPAARAWLDHVQDDLEADRYAFGSCGLPAACVGAPHGRPRIWWVADAYPERFAAQARPRNDDAQRDAQPRRGMGDSQAGGLPERDGVTQRRSEDQPLRSSAPRSVGDTGTPGAAQQHGGASVPVADADQRGVRASDCGSDSGAEGPGAGEAQQWERFRPDVGADGGDRGRRPTWGPWADAEWIPCRDGKARPVKSHPAPVVDGTTGSLGGVRATEPAFYPTCHGPENRVGQLRAYGNCILPQVAAEFVKAYLDC